MKKFTKIFIVMFILFFACACIIYIDYFIVKNKNAIPKLSIKEELSDSLVVYNAAFYRVWYCKTNDTYTIGNYKDKDATCPVEYKFDSDGMYENSKGIKISKHDLKLISDIYSSQAIENIRNVSELEDFIYVASEYGKSKYQVVMKNEVPIRSVDGSNIILFPEFKLNNDEYEWVYDNNIYYCMNAYGEVALFRNNMCGQYTNIKMTDKWCNLYTNSLLVYDDKANKLCKK